MPVAGDTLRHSAAVPYTTSIDLNNTGANTAWDFSVLTPVAQVVDTYRTVSQINPLATSLYGLPASCFGYKALDSIPYIGTLLGSSITVNGIYELFSEETNPSAFSTVGVSTFINGNLPFAAKYTDPDEQYFFPLAFGNSSTSTYYLPINIPTIGGITMIGSRTTTVDGWGTIKTPFYTAATACIRVRSESTEIDSVMFDSTTYAIPRTTVDYKWLVNGGHYPALWVTTTIVAGNEVVSGINYRDVQRHGLLSVANAQTPQLLTVYPNPATDGIIHLTVPANWTNFSVAVFTITGRVVATAENSAKISIANQPHGRYLVRVTSGNAIGYAQVVR